MTRLWRGFIAGGLLLIASAAGAQVLDGKGIPYRRWDVAATAGLHVDREYSDERTEFFDDEDWRSGLQVQADVGHYWNSHLKTEVSFAALTAHEGFASETVALPEGMATAYWQTRVRRTQVGAAMTYQFFENVFAHPYVSAGMRATIHDNHRTRQPTAWVADRFRTVSYPIPPLETDEVDLLVRPYLAAGFKSYFNERAFIRSELSTVYNARGLSQWSLRLGFGVDF